MKRSRGRWAAGILCAALILIVVVMRLGGGQEKTAELSKAAGASVSVRLLGAGGEPTRLVAEPKIARSEAEWRARLSGAQYEITRGAGTEPAFCGGFLKTKEAGVYSCVCCGLPLFSSGAKFESKTGWPSFWEPFAAENVSRRWDFSMVMPRIEIRCARCDAHLGHNFGDGPPPTRRRYCINSAALVFTPSTALAASETARAAQLQTAVFAAGCFWHVEETFRHLTGVLATQVGYAGGTTVDPTYEEISGHETGHAEAVEITYDSSLVSYDDLLAVFWSGHDPTTGDRQGPDVGSQYRSAIFFRTQDQETRAQASLRRQEQADVFAAPITTEIEPAGTFWRAEEYHQQYLEKQGAGCAVE